MDVSEQLKTGTYLFPIEQEKTALSLYSQFKYEGISLVIYLKLRHEGSEPSASGSVGGSTRWLGSRHGVTSVSWTQGLGGVFDFWKKDVLFKCGCFLCVGTEQKNKPTLVCVDDCLEVMVWCLLNGGTEWSWHFIGVDVSKTVTRPQP